MPSTTMSDVVSKRRSKGRNRTMRESSHSHVLTSGGEKVQQLQGRIDGVLVIQRLHEVSTGGGSNKITVG